MGEVEDGEKFPEQAAMPRSLTLLSRRRPRLVCGGDDSYTEHGKERKTTKSLSEGVLI